MIRFCDGDVGCVEYALLNRRDLLSYFLSGHVEEIVCVYDGPDAKDFVGIITYYSLLYTVSIDGAISREYLVLDQDIWKKARTFFQNKTRDIRKMTLIPVLNKDGQLICFAYQDEEANREIRMLRELRELRGGLQFSDVFPQYRCVEIHGFNELAFFFADYLRSQGIPIQVDGEMWNGFYFHEELFQLPEYECMHVYAEGTWGKKRKWKENLLKSVSVEFECIDTIYEANLRRKFITDDKGDFSWLMEKLKKENEIVLIGTDIDSLNFYDLLLKNGVEILYFCSEDEKQQRFRLFGKKILSENMIKKSLKNPVFINCYYENSAWGFGEIDRYDYEGYKRNQSYFCAKDYTAISIGFLSNILKDKNVILVGNLNLCRNVMHSLLEINSCDISFCDLLNEYNLDAINLSETDEKNITDNDIVFLIEPQYYCNNDCQIIQKNESYLNKLLERKINNISNYFSNNRVLAFIQRKDITRYTLPHLTPKGILLNISGHMSGNAFFENLLDGHPDILMMQADVVKLVDNLFLICIQLAEEKAGNILDTFWTIYSAISTNKEKVFLSHREVFDEKVKELLTCKDFFTPQELFVIFQIAYAKMYGKDISSAQNMLIFYEQYAETAMGRIDSEEWLCDERVKGYSIIIGRNSYIRVGSYFQHLEKHVGFTYPAIRSLWQNMVYIDCNRKVPDFWKRFEVKFEEIKTAPRETLARICDTVEIPWNDSLLETTCHGKAEGWFSGSDWISGFDLKPVYNLYEQYLSDFDRFRINMVFSEIQKRFDYPYTDCKKFSRKQLQEMFSIEFRFENKLTRTNDYWKDRKDFIDKGMEFLQRIRRKESLQLGEYL